MTKIKTGVSIPRDYGIIIQRPTHKGLLFSPSKYLEALKILSEKGSLQKVEQYGNMYSAEVLSRSCETPHKVKIGLDKKLLVKLSSSDHDCDCEDYRWSKVKKLNSLCAHIAALNMGMYLDTRRGNRSLDNSHTHLDIENRIRTLLPFFKGMNKNELMRLFDSFLDINGSINHYSMNRDLLEIERIYSPEMLDALETNTNLIRFGILKSNEQEVNKENLDKDEVYFYGASKNLEIALGERIRNLKGFHYEGHALEFKSTDHELVSQRYRNGDIVYSICINGKNPPFIVRKLLGEKTDEILESDDSWNEHPLLRDGEYESVDDATRRICRETIILPKEGEFRRIFVAKKIIEMYNVY